MTDDKYTQSLKEMYALGRAHALDLAVTAAKSINERKDLIVKLEKMLAQTQVAQEKIKELL